MRVMKLHLTELGYEKEKIVSNLGFFLHFLDEEIEAQRWEGHTAGQCRCRTGG